MTDTCTPPPGTASGTWHWLHNPPGRSGPYWWEQPPDVHWSGMHWRGIGTDKWAHEQGYRYIGPLTHPDEVAVLRSRAINALQILRAILEADERGQGLPFQIAMDNAIALLGGTP